jgi:Ni,Fe-hydrogenase I cytochrome b subunit
MQKEVISKAKKKNKKGIAIETLMYWLIAIAILVLMTIGYLIVSGKGSSGISFLENFLRRPS